MVKKPDKKIKRRDHLALCIWFYNYRSIGRIGGKMPVVRIESEMISDAMMKWDFETLEAWVLKEFGEYELKAAVVAGEKIAVIEFVNYSKGWVMPIARDGGLISGSVKEKSVV